MSYLPLTTLLLSASLSVMSCAPEDPILSASPPEYPGGGNTPGDSDIPPAASGTIRVSIGQIVFTATLADNPTAAAFRKMLPLTLAMRDFNSNEKVCALPSSIATTASNPGTIRTGDIMLYGSSSLVLFYETFSTPYSYTRIGRIDDTAGLKAALGAGDVDIKFE